MVTDAQKFKPIKGANGKYAGIHYVSEFSETKRKRIRRQATITDLMATREACQRAQDASDAIRRPLGLESVPRSWYRDALEARIAELALKPAPKVSRDHAAPAAIVRAADIARRRKQRDRDQAAANVELASMVDKARSGGESMVAIARALDMSRQAAYLWIDRNRATA